MRPSLLILLIIILISCSRNIPFDKNKWNETDEFFYKYRRQMINDLVNNHFKSRMDRKEIIELLGEPEEKVKIESDNDFKYLIFEDYGWDIDPVETAHLIIVFDKDSTIKKILMKKWKHHQDENFKELKIK